MNFPQIDGHFKKYTIEKEGVSVLLGEDHYVY
jgi:hypothetical protein